MIDTFCTRECNMAEPIWNSQIGSIIYHCTYTDKPCLRVGVSECIRYTSQTPTATKREGKV